jgi:hypothetical protein
MNSSMFSKKNAYATGIVNLSIIVAFAAILSTTLTLPIAIADNATNTVNITIQVNQKTLVTVDPSTLTWTGGQAVDPGTEGISKTIQIENMGSTNISYIWANTTYEFSPPFGTGIATNYNAGNFVALSRTNGTSDYYYFVNRVDYNETHPDIYLTLPANWAGYGRFRDGANEYFWVIVRGASNCTDGTFYMGKTPHNTTQTGTVDFSACDATLNNSAGAQGCRSGSLTQNVAKDWGYGLIYVGPNAAYHNYTVAVNAACNMTIFNHWNKDMPGGTVNPSFTDYLSTSTLFPGGVVLMYAKVKVAFGTAAGSVTQGFLTIIAQSA